MKVTANVYVIRNGATVFLRAGDTVPDGVEVTNPDAVEADAAILPAPPAEKPEDKQEAPAPAPKPRTRAKKASADSE